MMRLVPAIIFIAISSVLSTSARADILFLDLNNSPLEIKKAQEAADFRKEKLVVIPTQAWVNSKTPPQSIDAKSLSDLIQAALNDGHVFDSFILSGEHEVDNFFGANGKISKVDLGKIFMSTPALANSIRSVYGWGCYDSTLEMAQWFWPLCPNIQMIAGVDGLGVKHDVPSGLEYLYGALVSEKKVTDASDEKKDKKSIEDIIRAIPGFNQNQSVVYTKNACYSKTFGDIDPVAIAKSCSEEVHDTITDAAHDFFPMLYTPTVSEAVPCDTSGSWLRTYYDNLRDHDHCALTPGLNQSSFKGLTSSEPEAIRMIYFERVVSHFIRANSDDLKKLSLLAAAHPGFPTLNLNEGTTCGTQPGNSRQKIADWINQLGQLGQVETKLSGDDLSFLKQFQSKMNNQLINLQCVPSSWIDPIDTRKPEEQSSCAAPASQ